MEHGFDQTIGSKSIRENTGIRNNCARPHLSCWQMLTEIIGEFIIYIIGVLIYKIKIIKLVIWVCNQAIVSKGDDAINLAPKSVYHGFDIIALPIDFIIITI